MPRERAGYWRDEGQGHATEKCVLMGIVRYTLQGVAGGTLKVCRGDRSSTSALGERVAGSRKGIPTMKLHVATGRDQDA